MKQSFFKYEKLNLLNNNFFNLDKNQANSNFDKDFKIKKYSNNNHPFIKIINSQDVFSSSFYNNIYIKIKKTLDKNFFEKLNFEAVWLHKTTKEIYNSKELPYIPHIDKIRKFKVMIYLNDVNLDCGPLHVLNKDIDTEIFEKKRLQYKDNFDNLVNNYILDDYLPCVGNFGTSIFFDTNVPHFGGKLSDNKIRKILRYNFAIKK